MYIYNIHDGKVMRESMVVVENNIMHKKWLIILKICILNTYYMIFVYYIIYLCDAFYFIMFEI